MELSPRVNADNPEPRVAVALVVDVSQSMGIDNAIGQLNAGLRKFADYISTDEVAKKRVEVTLITFGGTVQVVSPFAEGVFFEPPVLQEQGNTPIASAMSTALDAVRKRKEEYKANGLEYYRPWIVVMSDGAPTDSPAEIERVVAELTEAQRRKGVTVFPMGVGDDADLTFLSRLSTARPAVSLPSIASFSAFFQWLSASLSAVSRSASKGADDAALATTEQVALPNPGWLVA
jgi:uncharacterized protein YegL